MPDLSVPAGPRFSVDPWDPSYGTSLDADDGADSDTGVDAGVELPPGRWQPLPPDRSVAPPSAVLFVDGVRRIDAQVWVHGSDGAAEPAVCASYAAGVVRCAGERAEPTGEQVERSLFTTVAGARDIVTAAGPYTARAVPNPRGLAPAQALSLGLQARLGEIEVAAATTARASAPAVADDLLVVDGPLRGRQDLPRVLGYVKTHRTPYLRKVGLNEHVAALGPGERTPLFLLTSSWQRYTWYLRLPTEPGSPWAGVVRVECTATMPADQAVAMARLSQVTLPRYASDGYKDSRAPQNLYPIAGLERVLRRRLGDAGVLYRMLRRAAAA